MAPVADVEVPEAVPVVDPDPPRRRAVLVPVLLALLVLAAGVIGWQVSRVRSLDGRVADLAAPARDRAEVADVAGRFGVALLTYDYRDLNAARQSVLDLATDRFDQEYTNAFVNGLDDSITQLQATARADVTDVFVGDVEADTAQAVVTLDSTVTSTAGTHRTVSSYIALDLKREDGRWRVDQATSLAALDEQTTPAPGETTTTSIP
jgi:Mce-associated membrane protein